MTTLTHRSVDRSVFRRLAVITIVMAVVILTILTVFFAFTVRPPFADRALNARLRAAHFTLLWPTLGLISVVVLVAHLFLLRLLLPLRDLADGVARLTRGELDVVVRGSTRDEFATLTNGFNQMVARVREMIGARDQLLLDVSHELRSPITRMKVALELMPDTELRTKLAGDVREMETLVTELLELERLRDGRPVLKTPVDVSALAATVVRSFAERRPPVTFTARAEGVIVDADASLLTIVLRNLIDNAVTHSLPDSAAVKVDVTRDGTSARIAVSDDGPGLPDSEAAHVFEAFYRLDRSRSRRTGGYGLGLSICKRAVDAHGGRIDIVPHQPRGTTFVVTLPLAAA